MAALQYTIIKTKEQYDEYCYLLENLSDISTSSAQAAQNAQDQADLLRLLIEKWDSEHTAFGEQTPVELLKNLMEANNLKAKDLSLILKLSKSTVSKILNYQKGLSKDTIRKLAFHFKVSQEAFNRPYKLVNKVNRHFKNESLMNTKKDILELT